MSVMQSNKQLKQSIHEGIESGKFNIGEPLPSKYQHGYYLREQKTFIHLRCKTERCKNSFLLSYVDRR